MLVPKDSERQLFIGATGSGKTTLGAHVLSLRDIQHMPHVILNTKDDELLNQIPHVIEVDGMKLPKAKHMKSGLLMVRPSMDDYDGIENLMREIWNRTHVGLFVDEALAISSPSHPAYRTLLTQGRSRRNPVDSLTQRPVNIDRYAFSESEHFYVMRLNSMRETEPIREQTGWDLAGRADGSDKTWMQVLPEYHAYRYHGPTQARSIVPPAPSMDTIIDLFDRKLRKTAPSYLI